MLFNSYAFLVCFLPITLVLYRLLWRGGRERAALGFLTAASLFFYGWWNPAYLVLLLGSIAFNHRLGAVIEGARGGPAGRRWLAFGVGANLAAIGWFKYAGFLGTTAATLFGADLAVPRIVLPLAISFFTFQQITYLVDVHRGTAPRYDLLRFALFVTFFPQLIAGPIVRHDETIPQFGRAPARGTSDLAIGASLFAVGLFKKVVLADTLATHATPVFDAAELGQAAPAAAAWGAALAYTFQLYFDFSGYCDMAIGAARGFGIRLPANFASPYRAANVIDFWRRWHMTLSRFLRDYLYVPLGGNRKGPRRRYVNLMITMLLGGLWHGAGWTFVLWGGLHGLYLVANHGWRALRGAAAPTASGRAFGWALTFLAVVSAWVLFRAESLDAAVRIYAGMVGAHGAGTAAPELVAWLLLSFAVALGLPNSQQWMADHAPVLGPVEPARGPLAGRLRFRPTTGWALLVAGLALYAFTNLTRESEFLYFQF